MIAIMSVSMELLFGDAPTRALRDGDVVFRVGAPVESVLFVRSGAVALVRHTQAGSRLVLHRARPGTIVAEASAWSETYHCDGVALGDTALAALPRAAFRAALAREPALLEAWAADLARAVQAARLRAEIRSLRTVPERLDAWLDAFGALPERGRRQEVAEEIGVTREALYRELARRDADGRRAP